MKKTLVSAALATVFLTFGANAADQGQGKVFFKGSVINAPCGIAPESADQSIDFGQISKAHLEANGISEKKDLDIKLVNCTFEKELLKTVKVTFSGTHAAHVNNELGTTGDTGTAIVISSADGTLVNFDGATASGTTKLKAGDNTLHYTSWVKKSASGGTLKEGAFTAVTNFNLTYE
ncbi:type 1 fimbrial protein [Escherichia coli]|uniref:fimbrial protein n=1 Tax=Escherichia coli TaxID=562 RepID=UPI0020C809AB|nr:fimbrial protein [Escherichia coli]MCP8787140.1 type 1 fimbrial protein [Escherichia coli]